MLLLADGGSTKTDWILAQKSVVVRRFATRGFNPNYYRPEELLQTLQNEIPVEIRSTVLDQLFFYGSGCHGEANLNRVTSALNQVFKSGHTEVHSDMLGAARGLLLHEPGLACILGTGSNSCRYDGNNIVQQLPSLGYLLGDEGSASHIGKRVLQAVLMGEAPAPLLLDFEDTYHLGLRQILDELYRGDKPGLFLSRFTHFAGKHASDPFIHALVGRSFDEFIQRQLMNYEVRTTLPVAFTGSVAYHFREILHERLQQAGLTFLKIEANPIEGLLSFHSID